MFVKISRSLAASRWSNALRLVAVLAGLGLLGASSPCAATGATSQTISYNGPFTVGVGETLSISATASSGLPLTFASTAPAFCTVSGSSVTGIATGQCGITATQAGNATYAPASLSTPVFVTTLRSQTIALTFYASIAVGATVDVGATASSGLPVTVTTSTPSVCSVAGSKVTGTALGTCTISALQAGNATYGASSASTSIAVTLQTQTITLTPPASIALGATGTVGASASSGLPVALTSATPSICSVSGSTVSGLAAGTCTVNASQNGNANFASAQASATIAITGQGGLPAAGYWWNPAMPGSGFVIEVQGGQMFMAGFLYSITGQATWVASSGPMTNATAFSGALGTYSGGQTLTGSYKAASQDAGSPGHISIIFTSSTTGTLTWPGGTIPIQRFDIVAGGSAAQQPASNPQTGWWWNPGEGGRGFAIEVQNGQVYLAGYMYDDTGKPVWYLASGPLVANSTFFTGTWQQFSGGTTLTGPFQPAGVANANVGNVILQFSDTMNATFFLPNGRQETLTRFLFGPQKPPSGIITEFTKGIPQNPNPYAIVLGGDGNLWFTEPGADAIGRTGRNNFSLPIGVSYKLASGAQPMGFTVGPEGDMWFTEFGADKIGHINAAGTITEYSAGITPGAQPFSIATGGDHNLWFTEQGGNRIGRITPLGVVTEFSAGISPNAGLAGITANADGTLWFAESNTGSIGRISPFSNIVTEYSAGISPGADPYGMLGTPDGNVWFTERVANRIGRITPTGAVTEFTDGLSANALPSLLTYNHYDSNIWFNEEATGSVGRMTPAGAITELKIQNNYLGGSGIAATPDGNMWATSTIGQTIYEFDRLGNFINRTFYGIDAGALPYFITTGADGNLWFTEGAADSIGRITPAGVVTNFSLPTEGKSFYGGLSQQSFPVGIAKGADGNVWFTENYANRIGMITPAGLITEFSDNLSASAGLQQIIRGPDGNMWFIESLAEKIGRITPQGVITEFTPPGNVLLVSIAAGADGSVWFTDILNNQIGRITPSGNIAFFSAGLSPNAGLFGITLGPDGNLWFVENSTKQIGNITPTGVVTEFSTHLTSNPRSIVAGPDGNLWFDESTFIGRITPAGVVTEFSASLSLSDGVHHLIAGPDGNVWFVDQLNNAVGKITP